MRRILGIDLGGSGSRVALRCLDAEDGAEFAGDRIGVTADGSTAPTHTLALLQRAASLWPEEIGEVVAVGIGATGLGTLVAQPAELVDGIEREMRRLTGRFDVSVAVAIDALAAHLGALGGGPGAIIALGTGAVAFGGDGIDQWHRVDGWGHLLGDRGGGAWIGLRGLETAIVAHDGVDSIGAGLLEAARRRFGEPATWPAQLYTRPDRAGVLAGFATDVAELAASGDGAAEDIMARAGRAAAHSAVAALAIAPEPIVTTTGGVFRAGGALTDAFETTLAALRPDATLRDPLGSPLDGALLLARRAAAQDLHAHVPFVWANR